MSDKKASVTVPHAISIMLFLFAIGVLGANMFAGLDVPLVSVMGLVTVGFALFAVAQSNAKNSEKPD